MALIALGWPRKKWFAERLDLLIDRPMTLSMKRSTKATSRASYAQQSPRAAPLCIEKIREQGKHVRFSSQVSELVSKSRRVSILKLYDKKWEVYRRRCRRRVVSVSNHTLAKVAEFLVFLFRRDYLQ